MIPELLSKFQTCETVLFDMDGVITDTMPRHCDAWKKAFWDYFQISVQDREIYLREGEKSEASILSILSLFSIAITENELLSFIDHKTQLFKKDGQATLFPGVENFIFQLSKVKRVGLVTGTPKKEVDILLDKKLKDLFTVIVTGDMVLNGKPNPEPYLKALKALNSSPEDTLVIENSPLGIESALRAKTDVCALPTTLQRDDIRNATYICNHHEELYQHFTNC